jgi:outer membrane murein-binding lipoprotein Lpp
MKNKTQESEITATIDKIISELVYDKNKLVKAYNYYHGKRDADQFRHLEENYGIGTPTAVEFVPLVRKHIDILIGEYLSTPVLPRVSCKDTNTLSNIHQEKQTAILEGVFKTLQTHFEKQINNKEFQKASTEALEVQLKNLIEDIDTNFISNYEIAGQNIVDYSMQSRNIDFTNKRKIILTDLLISGTCYYTVKPSFTRTNADLKVLNPLHAYVDRNSDSPYLKHSTRAVYVEYMTKEQILSAFGDFLNEEDLESLSDNGEFSDSTASYVRSYDSTVTGDSGLEYDGILGGFEVTPLYPYENTTSKYYRTYPVYFTEWLKADKENGEYLTNRYEGIRIGTNIYLPLGKSEDVVRSMDNPKECTLAINGIFYSDRNGDPTSLVLSTANLQDKYDILHFIRDNIIAESGTVGDWIDVAHLPTFLGDDVPERLMKFKAYKKQGLGLFDSSQEGEVVNTTFSGYDDSVKLNAIQAIDLTIQRTEETCSSITGVFRERLGGIEQKDAVTNVQVGIKNSALITKQYYQLMDLMTREILIDLLNIFKIVFKNGITGTLVLGDKLNKIFTALPEHYTLTDFDIHIADTTEVLQEIETIKQLSFEFTKSNSVTPDIILETVTTKGLTSLKAKVNKALTKQKEENGQLQQLSQQVEQLNQQLKEVSGEAQKYQQQVKQLNADKLTIEKEKLQFEKELGWFKAKSTDEFNDSKLELEKKRVELEGLQLIDDNPKNDEIKND